MMYEFNSKFSSQENIAGPHLYSGDCFLVEATKNSKLATKKEYEQRASMDF